MLTEEERMKLTERWLEVAPEGFKVIVHVGKLLREVQPYAGRARPKDGRVGRGSHGSSFPEDRTHRGIGEIHRRDCSRSPRPAFLLLPHPAFNGLTCLW